MTNNKFNFFSEPELKDELDKIEKVVSFKKDDIVVQPEKYIKVIPLLLTGTIKVLRVDGSGNELFLYHIEAGQSCAVSLSTCLMDKISNIKAVAEEQIELIAIPATLAAKWFDKFPSWRMFVLKTMDNRYNEIINTLDSVAFKNIDDRLIEYLLIKSKAIHSHTIKITHQEIATELSTSREVISRLLKQLEQKGKVKLFRNRVEIFLLCN